MKYTHADLEGTGVAVIIVAVHILYSLLRKA